MFVAFVVLALFYFVGNPITKFTSDVAQYISAPFWKIGNGISNKTSSISAFFSSKKRLEEENSLLIKDRAELKLKLLSREILSNENKELKKILGRDMANNVILGVVLARPNVTPYDVLIIDIGKDKNIFTGDLVMSNDFIIGEIIKTYAHSSLVELFSTVGKQIDVLIGKKNISAKAVGAGGQNFKIQLPHGSGVVKDDIVFAPDIGVKILGLVKYVNRDPNASLENALVISPVNVMEIKWVEVIRKQNEKK